MTVTDLCHLLLASCSTMLTITLRMPDIGLEEPKCFLVHGGAVCMFSVDRYPLLG